MTQALGTKKVNSDKVSELEEQVLELAEVYSKPAGDFSIEQDNF